MNHSYKCSHWTHFATQQCSVMLVFLRVLLGGLKMGYHWVTDKKETAETRTVEENRNAFFFKQTTCLLCCGRENEMCSPLQGLVVAGLADMTRPAEKLSTSQSAVLMATGDKIFDSF